MADITDQISTLQNRVLAENRADLASRLGASDFVDEPNAENTLSNTSFLLESLAIFYGDTKSEFFPTIITKGVSDRLTLVENKCTSLPEEGEPVPAASALDLLTDLEELFAYCLQYGLMTYGFSDKIAQKQVDLIRSTRQQTEDSAGKMLKDLKRHEVDLTRAKLKRGQVH